MNAEQGQQSGDEWGDDISDERKAELEQLLQAWELEADHGERQGPFWGVELTGADVFWLVKQQHSHTAVDPDRLLAAIANTGSSVSAVSMLHLGGLHLEGAILAKTNLRKADLRHANLYQANLGSTNLFDANLTRANFSEANLTGANLSRANLTHANLVSAVVTNAHLQQANLHKANLIDARLAGAHLLDANLSEATLDNADLREASLARASLRGASLRDTNLCGTELRGADIGEATLRLAHMDAMTRLANLQWDSLTLFADVSWNGAPLTGMPWENKPRLGDEERARRKREADGKNKSSGERLAEFELAERANRQLAVALRGQGLHDPADEYAYRAQVLHRSVLWRQALLSDDDLETATRYLLPTDLAVDGDQIGTRSRLCQRASKLLSYLGSGLLDVIAGYGYRPWRTLAWYLATIAGFAFAYYWTTHSVITFGLHPSEFKPLAWYEALVLSVSSFHGRGFLPFPNLGDPVTILAAIEAVFGLFIEVSFIATFTQRYFGK